MPRALYYQFYLPDTQQGLSSLTYNLYLGTPTLSKILFLENAGTQRDSYEIGERWWEGEQQKHRGYQGTNSGINYPHIRFTLSLYTCRDPTPVDACRALERTELQRKEMARKPHTASRKHNGPTASGGVTYLH